MRLRMLFILSIALAVGELVTMVILLAKDTADAEPVMFSVSALVWAVGGLLVRRGRTIPGAIVVALFALFHVASYPAWQRTSVLDWVWQSTYAAGSLACLGVALAVLVVRLRRPAVSS